MPTSFQFLYLLAEALCSLCGMHLYENLIFPQASYTVGYLEGTRCKSFWMQRFRCRRGLPSCTGDCRPRSWRGQWNWGWVMSKLITNLKSAGKGKWWYSKDTCASPYKIFSYCWYKETFSFFIQFLNKHYPQIHVSATHEEQKYL